MRAFGAACQTIDRRNLRMIEWLEFETGYTRMGLLRTLLALSVVVLHAPPYDFAPVLGQFAVPLFFAISGFLISYILIEDHNYPDTMKFYVNRILRLYPLYYVVLIMTVLAYVWEPYDWHNFHRLPHLAQAFMLTVNVTLVGQDWIYFLAVQGDRLVVSTDLLLGSEFSLWKFLVDAPSWSLGIELSFYLIAPFVLRRLAWIMGLLVTSLLARVMFLWFGPHPIFALSYLFFPFELSIFLLGALSHRYLLPVARRLVAQHAHLRLETVVTVGTLAAFGVLLMLSTTEAGVNEQQRIALAARMCAGRFAAVGLLCLALPFLFIFQTRFRFDALIGELSYPIYICHRFVIIVAHTWVGRHAPALSNSLTVHWIMIGGALALALVLDRLVVRQVEPLRNRIKRRTETLRRTDADVPEPATAARPAGGALAAVAVLSTQESWRSQR